MTSMETLIIRYGLEDPVDENPMGVFVNPTLQTMSDDLVARGSQSPNNALKVGALIEGESTSRICSAVSLRRRKLASYAPGSNSSVVPRTISGPSRPSSLPGYRIRADRAWTQQPATTCSLRPARATVDTAAALVAPDKTKGEVATVATANTDQTPAPMGKWHGFAVGRRDKVRPATWWVPCPRREHVDPDG
jgi:hypothetical protein